MFIFHLISIVTLKIGCVSTASSLVAPSRLLITRIGPCYGTNLPVSISEMSVTRKQFDFTISGRLNVSVDVAIGWSIKATMQKCHDIRNLDTCDHYKSLTVVKSGCDGEDEDDQLLQDKFFQYVTPRLGCPLQPGVYQISNYPFVAEDSDLTATESKISTSVFGYTYRLDGFDDDYQKILCVDTFLQLIYVRNHDWIGNQKVKPVRVPAKNYTANDTADRKRESDEVVERDDATKDVEHYDDDTIDDNHGNDEVVERDIAAAVKDNEKQDDTTENDPAGDIHGNDEVVERDGAAEVKEDETQDDATDNDPADDTHGNDEGKVV